MTDAVSISDLDLPAEHMDLVEAAAEATREAYDPDRFGGAHLVGAAVRSGSGTVYTGVSLPTQIGRASTCAEPVAIGAGIDAGAETFEACVAVGHPRPAEDDYAYEVIPPCGVCRELLADYGESMTVLVPEDGVVVGRSAASLVPNRTW